MLWEYIGSVLVQEEEGGKAMEREKRTQISTTVVQAPESGSEWPSTHQQIRQEGLPMILGPVLTALGIYSA